MNRGYAKFKLDDAAQGVVASLLILSPRGTKKSNKAAGCCKGVFGRAFSGLAGQAGGAACKSKSRKALSGVLRLRVVGSVVGNVFGSLMLFCDAKQGLEKRRGVWIGIATRSELQPSL